jgi:hypothetical protein
VLTAAQRPAKTGLVQPFEFRFEFRYLHPRDLYAF